MNEEERDLEAELKEEKDRFEAQNQEAYDKEVSGENEIKAAYEKNRERLKKTREESADPDRFQSQLETIKSIAPDPTDPREISEFFTDMAVDAGILGRSLGEDLPTGIATVIARRLAKSKNVRQTIEDGLGKVAQIADEVVEPENGFDIMQKVQFAMSANTPNTPGNINPPRGFQQLGAFYKKGDLGKQLLKSDRPVVNMTKRDGVVTLNSATITEVEKIIDDLEAFHDKGLAGQIPKWKLDRPTSQYRGKRRVAYTKPDGTPGQLYLNWSASKQTYVARDVDKLIKAKMNRAVWNVPQSGKKGQVQSVYKSSKAANSALNQKLLSLFDDDPELMQKIIGDTKQIVYVEHIHPGRSPYWNKNRDFGPGDPENLLVIEDTIFPKVKTAIEKQLYDSGRYKNIYADMDAGGDILLKDATTDKLIGRIPGITNQSQVKAGIYRALTGKQPMDLVDIDPTLRPYLAKLHGFDTEDFGRLKDVQAGVPSKAQDKFEEISRLIESKEVQLEASKTGVGKKLSVIKEDTLAKEIKALRQQREQLKLFDTGSEGTGLRTQRQKIKIKKPKRVKKSVGETKESVQIPIEYQGPKYKK